MQKNRTGQPQHETKVSSLWHSLLLLPTHMEDTKNLPRQNLLEKADIGIKDNPAYCHQAPSLHLSPLFSSVGTSLATCPDAAPAVGASLCYHAQSVFPGSILLPHLHIVAAALNELRQNSHLRVREHKQKHLKYFMLQAFRRLGSLGSIQHMTQ